MEISAQNFSKLIGITSNHSFLSNRHRARKQLRKLRKKLGGLMPDEQIKILAQEHPVGDVEIFQVNQLLKT